MLGPWARAKQAEASLLEATQRMSRQDARLRTLAYRLSEAESRTEAILARNNAGDFTALDEASVSVDVKKARAAYQGRYKDAAGIIRRMCVSRRLVNMHAEYCFGGGVEAPTVGDGDGTGPGPVDRLLRDWWFDYSNQRAMFNVFAQHQRSANLLVDGSVFIACVDGAAGRPMQCRWMDTQQFRDVVTHPEDETTVLYYQRRFFPKVYNTEQQRWETSQKEVSLYYPDIDNDGAGGLDDPYADVLPIAEDRRGRPIHAMRMRLNALTADDRGDGIMRELMDYELSVLQLVEDQMTVSASTAALANQLYVQGQQAHIDAAAAHFGQSGDDPSTYPPNPGDINILPEWAKLSTQRASTNALDNRQNIRMLQMPMAAIAGVALHYMGDPENANLATATAMEGPVLKHFEAYQSYWAYAYARLALKAAMDAGYDLRAGGYNLNVPMPELVVPDLLDRFEAIGMMSDREWANQEQATREAWISYGAADPTSEAQKALDTQGQEDDTALPTTEMTPGAPIEPSANPE